MKPTVKLAAAETPDGGKVVLYQHDRDYSITVNGQSLMDSHQHESELELARLGCAHLADHPAPRVVIGGLGMGYTLRQTLEMVGPHATVVVVELLEAVLDWNRDFLQELNGRALEDKRVEVRTSDVVTVISQAKRHFDAILLDIDNGPRAMTDSGNRHLYGHAGILACRQALRDHGVLAVWSAEPSKAFEQLLLSCHFHIRRFRVPAYHGSKSLSRFVWVAAQDPTVLPPERDRPERPRGHKMRERTGLAGKNG